MLSIQHNGFVIKVFDDSSFDETPNSPTSYQYIYHSPNSKGYRPNSQHAITVYKNGEPISNAILLAAAGGTSVTPDAVIVEERMIITRCCNTVFSLSLPDLQLNWMAEVDLATCFSIHPYQDSYITHGEIAISRINKTGHLLWEFTGADIFVCLDKDNAFIMKPDCIELTDFNGKIYTIDYDGKLLKETPN